MSTYFNEKRIANEGRRPGSSWAGVALHIRLYMSEGMSAAAAAGRTCLPPRPRGSATAPALPAANAAEAGRMPLALSGN